jgi:predicted ester cyclase
MSAASMSEIQATVRRFYEALSIGEVSLVDRALAPEWEAIPDTTPVPGAEGWKVLIVDLRRVFPDLTVTIEDVVVAGDRAAVRSITRGTHSGEFLGVSATGKKIQYEAFDIHRLENGLIAQTWHLEDYFSIAAQIGLVHPRFLTTKAFS